MSYFFMDCEKLEYIKLNNFKEGRDIQIDDIFKGVPDNLIYCINNNKNMSLIMGELNNKICPSNDCSEDWSSKIKLIIEEKKDCVYNCNEDGTYSYQYKNKCYNTCPNGTILSTEIKKCLIACPENFPFEKN